MSEFPQDFTLFQQKTNAQYDGDPAGDYIKAEHINVLQDAVAAIEQSIGLVPHSHDTLATRLKQLEHLQPVRVPSVGVFHTLHSDIAYTISVLDQYRLVVLTNPDGETPAVLDGLQQTEVFGDVDATLSLADIQNTLAVWQQLGASGIRLRHFGEGDNPTREKENTILRSAKEHDLTVMLQSTQWTRLLDDTASQPYNPTGEALLLDSDSIVELHPFAYDGRARTPEELIGQTLPLVKNLRDRQVKLLGWSNADTSGLYDWTHGAAVLFGLDYLYAGRQDGESIATRTPLFSVPNLLAHWQTTDPVVFQEGPDLVRRFEDGAVRIGPATTVSYDGISTSSRLLNWLNDTVPGQALKPGSVSPDKLSTYDIQRIVDLLNSADDTIRIDSTKIEADPGGAGLPVNIPASNMTQNVIEAINRTHSGDYANTLTISDASIDSLSAGKLTGDIEKDRLTASVTQAINAAGTQDVFINVPKLNASDINSTGTIDGETLIGDNLTVRMANITSTLTTVDQTLTGTLTANDGSFISLYVQNLEVDTLTGLEDLHVGNLTADTVGTTLIDAIKAHIETGTFNTIVTKALTATTIQTDLITSLNSITDSQITNSALFQDAVITDAKIANLSATKLSSGTVDTSVINISSDQGHLQIQDKTLKIYDNADIDGNRRLRVLIGATGDVTQDDNFGLVVLGEDGTTRLYDNTGVYNAGLHDNVISESKIQDNAISERVIAAGAVHTEQLFAGAVVADKIATDAILANHILAGEIVGRHIQGETIEGSHIKAGSIAAGHIQTGSIEAKHVKAGSISADRLSIGFKNNLVRHGFDSFEQDQVGDFRGVIVQGETSGEVRDDWSYDGTKALFIQGNAVSNQVMLEQTPPGHSIAYTIPVMAGRAYFVSAYVRPEFPGEVPVTIGLAFNDATYTMSDLFQTEATGRVSRIWHRIVIPDGVLRANVVLGVEATNTGVYFDSIQVEEREHPDQTDPGFWKTTAATRINGDNIETGRITSANNWSWLDLNDGEFSFAGGAFNYQNDRLTITADSISIGTGAQAKPVPTTEDVNAEIQRVDTRIDEVELTPGPQGQAAIVASLSNDTHVVVTDSEGHYPGALHVESALTVFAGVDDVTSEWEIGATPSAGVDGLLVMNIYTVTALTEDSGTVTFTATKDGQTLSKVFTLIKNKPGQDATIYSLEKSHAMLIQDIEGNLNPSVVGFKGKQQKGAGGTLPYSGYFKIYERATNAMTMDEYTILEQEGKILPDKEYLIASTDQPYVLRYTSSVTESSKNYVPNPDILSLHIELYKDAECTELLDNETIMVARDGKNGEDVYDTKVFSTQGDKFKNGNIETTLYAKVYRGTQDITDNINAGYFRWTRASRDYDGDLQWNANNASGRKSIDITRQDVYVQATFQCDITNL